jgi:hypothetical protein
MRSSLFWDISQLWVVVLCRRFGTTYRSIFKSQECQEEICLKSGKNVGHLTWRPKYVLLFPATQIRHKSMSVRHWIFVIVVTVACRPATHKERIVAFSFQQWLHQLAKMLRYTFIAYRVEMQVT